jgi:hypothetical protein
MLVIDTRESLEFKTETETVRDVGAAIQKRLGWQVRDVQVVETGEGVVLQGEAASYFAKQLSQHIAMDFCGAGRVTNEIVVL